ncbi:SspB family protein [Rhodovulum sp. PH10]|uniref:SspB family protein n=1 Tax=Rhodovulum sp. PH10 TaxID=1187851 RepID=UPI00058B1EB7|nr:ClpXP protease specificity-enhancing factor SspB [Rhodovulum sp. PH10]
MPTDFIRYDILTQDALRGVVRTVLTDAAAKGLPGEHHFYISFDTRAPGVKLSPRLLGQYPEEMTIVLQHQFWDLTVKEDVFEVGLSFNGIPERLVVPLAAIKGFFDPSVQFGLEFAVQADLEAKEPDETPALGGGKTTPERPPATHLRPAETEIVPAPANPSASSGEPPPDKPAGGGEVVRLDRFRKK